MPLQRPAGKIYWTFLAVELNANALIATYFTNITTNFLLVSLCNVQLTLELKRVMIIIHSLHTIFFLPNFYVSTATFLLFLLTTDRVYSVAQIKQRHLLSNMIINWLFCNVMRTRWFLNTTWMRWYCDNTTQCKQM